MFLPSFTEENFLFEKEFNSYFKNGLNIQSKTKLEDDANLNTSISLFPMKMIPIMRNGKPTLTKTNTTEMNFAYSKIRIGRDVSFF